MEGAGLFTTIGDPINAKGTFSSNIHDLVTQVTNSAVPLYLSIHSDTLDIVTYLDVDANQKFSRNHAIIYIEEYKMNGQIPSTQDLQVLIVGFYQRCKAEAIRLGYSISQKNSLLNYVSGISQLPSPKQFPKEITHYLLGRSLVGSETVAYSRDPVTSINHLLLLFELRPNYLKDNVTMIITKSGFGKAQIVVTNSPDRVYHINADEMTISSSAYKNNYSCFATLREEMSDADLIDVFKEKILQNYAEKYLHDTNSKEEYRKFLKTEGIKTKMFTLDENSSKHDEKKEVRINFIPKISFGKNKSETESEINLVVNLGDKRLVQNVDYVYNPETGILNLSTTYIAKTNAETSENSLSFGNTSVIPNTTLNSNQRHSTQQDNSRYMPPNDSRLGASSPSSRKLPFSWNSQSPRDSSSQIKPISLFRSSLKSQNSSELERPSSAATGNTSNEAHLPTSLFIFGIGEAGLWFTEKLVSETSFINGFEKQNCKLSLYTYFEAANSEYNYHIQGAKQKISESIPSHLYMSNPTVAHFIYSKAERVIFICHENEFETYNYKLRNYVKQIKDKCGDVCSLLLLVDVQHSNGNFVDSNPWLDEFAEVICSTSGVELNNFGTELFTDFVNAFQLHEALTTISTDSLESYETVLSDTMNKSGVKNSALEPTIEENSAQYHEIVSDDVSQYCQIFDDTSSMQASQAAFIHDMNSFENDPVKADDVDESPYKGEQEYTENFESNAFGNEKLVTPLSLRISQLETLYSKISDLSESEDSGKYRYKYKHELIKQLSYLGNYSKDIQDLFLKSEREIAASYSSEDLFGIARHILNSSLDDNKEIIMPVYRLLKTIVWIGRKINSIGDKLLQEELIDIIFAEEIPKDMFEQTMHDLDEYLRGNSYLPNKHMDDSEII